MPKTVTVTAASPMEEIARATALSKIQENLTTKELSNLATLVDNPKAKAYFGNDSKFAMLKKLL